MNNKYIEDFNTVLKIYESDYSHEELMQFIKEGNIAQKQAAILKLDKIYSCQDAEIIIQNLIQCDGKIREAISFRLPQFFKEEPQFFVNSHDILLEAIVDINGNICRNTIAALEFLKPYDGFTEVFSNKLLDKIPNVLNKVKNFDIQDGKYKINKDTFKLYWYLECLNEFSQFIPIENLKQILKDSACINDYTIREKTAKILTKISSDVELLKIRKQLQNDENYYVRRL